MSNLTRHSEKDNSRQRKEPVSGMPQPMAPEEVVFNEVMERALQSEDLEELAQALLDEAIKETFPASDPISVSTFEELAIEMAQRAKAVAAAARR